MDVVAHAVYGATLCSRSGLAGGSKGTGGRPWTADWTFWCTMLFGVLPDLLSLGLPFLAFFFGDRGGNFFKDLQDTTLIRYRYMHSLLPTLLASGALRLVCKPLFVPSLAWPLHVVTDSFTHGVGKFHTTLFYPLSTWGFDGVRWWEHPGVILAYWLVLPVIWLGLWSWRRRQRGSAGPSF